MSKKVYALIRKRLQESYSDNDGDTAEPDKNIVGIFTSRKVANHLRKEKQKEADKKLEEDTDEWEDSHSSYDDEIDLMDSYDTDPPEYRAVKYVVEPYILNQEYDEEDDNDEDEFDDEFDDE